MRTSIPGLKWLTAHPGGSGPPTWLRHLGQNCVPSMAWPPGPLLSFSLLTALPTLVSGLIKELCGLFMYGPSLIGVFVFSHYSQLDRTV